MIECYVKSPLEGYYWPRRVGGVPRVGDYVEGRTSWSHDAECIRLRVVAVTHLTGGDGWTPAVEVEVERDLEAGGSWGTEERLADKARRDAEMLQRLRDEEPCDSGP